MRAACILLLLGVVLVLAGSTALSAGDNPKAIALSALGIASAIAAIVRVRT